MAGVTHGAGTTWVSARLAAALADQGHRVLVADVGSHRSGGGARAAGRADLPTLLSVNGAAPRPELQPATVVPSGVSGVDYLRLDDARDPTGRPVWRTVAALVGEVADHYDLVLLDGPPVLPYADAVAAADAVDGVVLVARAERTSGRALRIAKARLATGTAALAGGVLNRVTSNFQDME